MSYQFAENTTSAWTSSSRLKEGFTSSIRVSGSSESEVAYLNLGAKPIERKAARPSSSRLKVKRRLTGFFVQEEGAEARVAFVDGKQLVHYYLPIQPLRDAGISVENQPFEYDELESVVDGVVMTGFRFRPAAKAGDSYQTSLALDPVRKAKMDYILKRDWNASA